MTLTKNRKYGMITFEIILNPKPQKVDVTWVTVQLSTIKKHNAYRAITGPEMTNEKKFKLEI